MKRKRSRRGGSPPRSPKKTVKRTWGEFFNEYKYSLISAAAATVITALLIHNEVITVSKIQESVLKMTGHHIPDEKTKAIIYEAQGELLSQERKYEDADAKIKLANKALATADKEVDKLQHKWVTTGSLEIKNQLETAKNVAAQAKQTVVDARHLKHKTRATMFEAGLNMSKQEDKYSPNKAATRRLALDKVNQSIVAKKERHKAERNVLLHNAVDRYKAKQVQNAPVAPQLAPVAPQLRLVSSKPGSNGNIIEEYEFE